MGKKDDTKVEEVKYMIMKRVLKYGRRGKNIISIVTWTSGKKPLIYQTTLKDII